MRIKVDKENLIEEVKLSELLKEIERLIKPFRNNFSYEVIGSGDTVSKVLIKAELFTR